MNELRSLGPLLQLSWVVAFSTLIPLGIGIFLDRRLGTAPLFILIGAAVGILAGTVGAVRVAGREIDTLGATAKDVAGEGNAESKTEDTAHR